MYEVCPEKVYSLLRKQEQFEPHWCNLAAKESRLECVCVNSDNFIALVTGVVDALEWAYVLCGHHIQNDWASRAKNLHQILC